MWVTVALARPPPSPKPVPRRQWPLLLLPLAFVLAFVWCSEEPEPPPPTKDLFVAEPEPLPPPPPPPEAPRPIDSGSSEAAPLDAGLTPLVHKEPDVEAYMQRWRDALAPLFRLGKQPTGVPQLIRAMAHQEPDAGSEPCAPRVELLSLRARPRVDLVVVVDTSGSMYRALPRVAQWLGELEGTIVERKRDVQLLVVADQRHLRTWKRVDAGGVNSPVGSDDALEVIFAGATRGTDRWTSALRPGAELRIVVVTDDNARGTGEDFVNRLTEVLGGTRFSFNLLGGLDSNDGMVIAPEQPITRTRCSAEGINGLNSGEAYQEAAVFTKGLRAPLCWEKGRSQLLNALVELPTAVSSCMLPLNSPGHRVVSVDAEGPNRAPRRLLEERASCYAMRRGYRVEGAMLALCEDTCAELRADGYEELEVMLECRE